MEREGNEGNSNNDTTWRKEKNKIKKEN